MRPQDFLNDGFDNEPSFQPPHFERLSKRRRGYPSESKVKRGRRVVHGDKELREKLGRRDLCPCGSGQFSNNAACAAAAFDGVNRDEYF